MIGSDSTGNDDRISGAAASLPIPEWALRAAEGPAPERCRQETAGEAAERAELRERGRRRLWDERVPLLYSGASLDRLHAQQDPDGRARGYLDSGRPNLLVMGPSRRGKTYLCYAIGNEARTRGIQCVAWTAPELSNALWVERHETREDVSARRGTLHLAQTADLVYIDDLGRERPDQFGAWLERLWLVLDTRVRQGLRTVVSANATDAQGKAVDRVRAAGCLRERYGDPIARRLFEGSVAVWVDGDVLQAAEGAWDPFAEPGSGQ
jgi:hypothetical protein